MKIEQGPFQEISNLLPQYKEKALAGRFFHCKRVFVIKSAEGYLAATFTIFERFKMALLHILGKDYTLKGKKITFITNTELEKLIPVIQVAVPATKPPVLPAQAQPAGAPAAVPGLPQQPAVAVVAAKVPNPAQLAAAPANVPQAHQPAAVAAAAVPAHVPQPLQPAVAAPAAVPSHVPQPLQPAAVVLAAVPGVVPQPPQAAAAAPAAALPQVAVLPPQLSDADIERIVKQGLPYANKSLADLEALTPRFEEYMKDRQYQENNYKNSSDVFWIDCDSFNKYIKPNAALSLNNFQMFIRLMVFKGNIAAFVQSRNVILVFKKEEEIVWDTRETYNREKVFTKAKLQEVDQYMAQVRFPRTPIDFTPALQTRYQEMTRLIEETQLANIQFKDSRAGKVCELLVAHRLEFNEVMDFLVKANVIYAWNYFPGNNYLVIKFAPTDAEKAGAAYGLQAWRDAALIQREKDFQSTHRITLPADLSNFKSAEQERLKKIVELLNKRVAFGQPSGLDRNWADEKLLKWLQDQKLIVGYEANNAIAPFRIYVKEEDRNA